MKTRKKPETTYTDYPLSMGKQHQVPWIKKHNFNTILVREQKCSQDTSCTVIHTFRIASFITSFKDMGNTSDQHIK